MTANEFIWGTLTSVVGNVLTVFLGALIVVVGSAVTGKINKIKSKKPYFHLIATDAAIVKLIQSGKETKVTARFHRESRFRNILPEWEVEFLVKYYDRLTGSRSYNGRCIRLDGYEIENGILILDLSEVGFFDLLSTNITFFPGNVRYNFWNSLSLIPYTIKYLSIMSEYKTKILGRRAIENFTDILTNNRLANVLAVSTNILDKQGRALIVKRSSKLSISGNIYTVASTGTVLNVDLPGKEGNVLTRAAAREIKEEIGMEIPPGQIHFVNLILTKQKYQPIAITEYYLEDINQAIASAARAKDFQLEIKEMHVLDLKDISTFFAVITSLEFSPASAYSLELAFRQLHGLTQDEFKRLMKKHKKPLLNQRLSSDWKKRSKVITTS
ncbi:hypothetical protein SAMN02745218_02478 [Desulfofundulus australicus DSM 11792]|jgi:isopentenyldiphosphate isomerase|uniref:Nudix hydrolase domain-containing protein n=1 Tax=Desulfofundulus australicus DSM 11792 TaxID=1121425 RepID=A0A1M5CBR5_9FIRM|nr:NUDIX domain-containing protein [Desulfofundulus australicus]SHF52151.1 hypothetical protein SAMN02745218_02478 [Desulfofundulus australicus DSM 11792]